MEAATAEQSDQGDGAVVVTVAAVRVVQVAVDQVVYVIAVGNSLMAAAGAMRVAGCVAAAGVRRRTCLGVRAAHREHVLIDMIFVIMVKVAGVQVISMVAMKDGAVAAVRAMDVLVVFVPMMAHVSFLSVCAASTSGQRCQDETCSCS